MLRLEPSDPAVRERTAAAVEASNTGKVKPKLYVHCAKCDATLAMLGDIPGFGTLFSSSWTVPFRAGWGHEGEELQPRALDQWGRDHEVVVSESGRPMNELHHGVIALLALPAELVADYPDLLMRCGRHGDCVGNRFELIQALRRRRAKYRVMPTGAHLEYEPPHYGYLQAKSTASRKVSRLKMDVMPIEEFERLRAANYRRDPG